MPVLRVYGKPSVAKNFLVNSLYQLLQVITPLVSAPYLARRVGPSGIGIFAYTQSVVNYFLLFAMLGMSTYGVRLIARTGDDRAARSREFSSAFLCQFLTGAAVVVAYLLYLASDPSGGFQISAIWILWVIGVTLDVSWLLFGVEEFVVPTVRSISVKLATLCFIFMFVKAPSDLWVYVLIIAGGQLLNYLLLWPFIWRYVDWVKPSLAEVVAHWRPSLRLFLPVIAISVYTVVDKIMLGWLTTFTEVGYFEYAEKFSRLPLLLVTGLTTVMLPRMSRDMAEGREEVALQRLEASLWWMIGIASALGFGISAIASEFVPFFLGRSFAACIAPLSVMAAIIPIVSVTNVIGRQYMLPALLDRWYTGSLVVGAVVNVGVNLTLIRELGALGAAVGTVAAEFSILVVQLYVVRRRLPVASYIRTVTPTVLCGALMMLCVKSCSAYLVGTSSTLKVLVVEVLVGVFVYLVSFGLYVWCADPPAAAPVRRFFCRSR